MFTNKYCAGLVSFCTSVHMPLFFVIAGFCWSCRDYKTYMRKKFLRLAVPYVVFNLIDMLPRYLLSSLVRRPKPISESVMNMLLYGGEFWFLYVLFIVFMVYPLIFSLTGRDKIRMSVVAVLMAGLSLYGLPVKIFLLGRAGYYLFFFHAGVMAREFSGGKWPRLDGTVWFLPVMMAVWLFLLWEVEELQVLTACAGIAVCVMMARYGVFSNIFARFGEYSLQLYLLNGLTLGVSRAIICNVLNVTSYPVIIIFNMLVDFLGSYVLIKYVLAKNKTLRFSMGMASNKQDLP